MELGNKLKDLRLSKELTQEELAEVFHLKKSSISRYESNQQIPELDMLVKIAKYFNITTDYLLGLEEDLKELKVKVTLEDEVKALKIVNDNLAIAEEVLNQVDISRKSYYAGRVDILKDVLQEITDKL